MQTQARFSRRDLIKLAASGAAVTSPATPGPSRTTP